ncbi:MAG: SdrD B-like domain-containing protein [Thiohalomonadaceae bacterium]
MLAVPADGATGVAAWNIGEVVTQGEDDLAVNAIAPLIRIDYYARIHNAVGTDAGDVLQNGAELDYRHGQSGTVVTLTDSTAPVTVVEPTLTIAKQWANVTAGKGPTDTPVGGDVLEYTVTIANTGDSTAHDANIVDTLTPHLVFDTGYMPVATIDGSPVAGFVGAPAGALAGPLVWGRDNGDGSLDVPPGATLQLVYRVIVADTAQPGHVLGNSVRVDWTSLEGASGYERTGAGCPVITAPDDYCAGPAATSTTITDANAMVKTVVADSFAEAPFSTDADATVRVADTATYRLAVTLQGGSTRAVRIEDVLPAGVALDAIVSIAGDLTPDYTPPPGSSFSFAPVTAAKRPAPGATGTLVWDLGTVVASRTDVLEIVFRVRVLPDAGLAHVASTTLTNTATLNYLDAADAPVARSDGADLTVNQPVIAAITKIDRTGRSSGAPVVLSDTMAFRVSACNSGAAPAYDVRLRDQLPAQLDETTLAGPVNGAGFPDVYLDGTLAVLATDYTWTPPAASGGHWQVDLLRPLAPGQCVHVDYDIGFAATVGLNEAWQNSATVEHYFSLPAASGQQYGPVGPAVFSMHNVAPIYRPLKEAVTTGEVTIGDEVIYRITVPGTGMNAAMHDVVVSDTLHPALEFVEAVVEGSGQALANTATAPNGVRLELGSLPALTQVTVLLRARVANNDFANAGVSFGNTASYTFANTPGGAAIAGGSATTAETLKIVEPRLTLAKGVENLTSPGNPPRAGHILRYTLDVAALGGTAGDDYAGAWDISVLDTLAAGLAYHGNATVTAGNTIGAPVVSGDGATGQTLRWSPADGNVDIDVAEGTSVQIAYEVRVLDTVSADQPLANAAVVQWTGQDGADVHERDGSGTPAYNDYFTAPAVTTVQTPDVTAIAKRRLTDSFGAADDAVRVGDVLHFELRARLNEGTTPALVVVDTLPQGLAFEGVVSVNGASTAPFVAVAPFSHAPVAAPAVSGDPATGPSTVTWSLGAVTNAGDGDAANDDFVIVYAARVLNDTLAHVPDTALANAARLDYQTFSAPASRDASYTVTARQPVLTVSKTAAPEQGDAILAAGERVTYSVEIHNTGSAPAYDVVLRDVIPPGMRHGAATLTMLNTTLAGAPVADVQPVYDAATGIAIWDFGTGVADAYTIPPGAVLRIQYQVQTDADLGAGLTLTNAAQVQRYYSFDDEDVPSLGGVQGVRQVYGPSNTASVDLYSAAPNPLAKDNPAGHSTAAVGEPFSYRITVPATPQAAALHDVRIIDDLSASAADLRFVSVQRFAGSQPWTPVNTGTATALVIEDLTNGIDIPAGEQIVIDVTVVLEDSATNVSGLAFHNTAHYTYTAVNGDETTRTAGGADTTADLIIAGPDSLTLDKSGPASMRTEVPGAFTLDVHNTGTGTAWDLTIVDRLPDPQPGGMCDTAPDNITAQIFEADGVTPAGAPLAMGSDFTAAFTGAPACELTFTMISPAAALGAGQHLRIGYQAWLDGDNVDATALTNVAGAVRWFSADTDGTGAGGAREYTRALTDGTVGTLDHEDAHTVTAEMPVIEFHKSVTNVTTGQDPGSDASPGDVLRYSVRVRNVSSLALSSFSLRDELDRLNGSAMFVPGSLRLVTVPAGADTSATDGNGGASGTGLVVIGNLSLDAQGGANDSLLVEFEARLAPVITSGSEVLNQAQLISPVVHTLDSDDPNINGGDRPDVLGDEDPTRTLIQSAPQFRVHKISTDVSGDPAMLMAGDVLRYTLTIKNVGSENAADVTLRDAIPVHTTYVPNSTRLNGVSVPDPAPGVSPLEQGMPVHAPEDATPGALRADADDAADNVATVTFDVRIDPNVVNGTAIVNQGFVTGAGLGSGATGVTPSDDPDTPALDDPTRDVVGNVPLLDVMKTAALVHDQGTPGIVDPGDVVRYTFTIVNTAATPATGVVLRDGPPANTTYVADSTTLNGLTVPDPAPAPGVSPLVAGVAVSSSDRTPPLPAGGGIVSGYGSATVTFDVVIDAGVAPGTDIPNQGTLISDQQDPEPSDADGIDSNGDQVTVVTVGPAQRLAITKEVFVVGGSTALPGGELEYVVRVRNTGNVPATHVIITDDLNALAGLASYVTDSARLDGSTTGLLMPGGVLTADYSTTYGPLAPGATAELRFRVTLEPGLAAGTRITNTAQVGWDSPRRYASASASVDIGGTPGSVTISGHVWHDANLQHKAESGEAHMAGWTVEVLRGGTVIGTALTDASGRFSFTGLTPNDPGLEGYEVRLSAPGASNSTAALGWTDSDFTGCSTHPVEPCWRTGMQRISHIVAPTGSNVLVNLPLQPHGVVYDAVLRTPVAGAKLTLVNPGDSALPAHCFDDPAQQGQITGADGHYRFDLRFEPGCAVPGNYLIRVTPPANGYMAGPSRIIPPVGTDGSNPDGTPYSVPVCADDAVPATTDLCEVQASAFAPPTTVAARTPGTNHHINLLLGNAQIPRDSQLFNNHIAVDPTLDTAIAITKTAALVNVTRGQLVPYTITLRNTLTAPLHDLAVVDSFPAGFKYVEGSARVDGEAVEPVRRGLQLAWEGLDLGVDAQHTITLLLVVGSGVSEGDYVNRAQVFNLLTGAPASGEASATVRVVPDATFDCTDIIGKVFDDANRNGYQDEGEGGLAGVRLVSARGLIVTTDEHGRFHITCAVVPDEDRGSNFILKLDDRSLPSGYRVTTENPLVLRATRGKMMKFNFGAALHRVVSLGMADEVFEPGSVTMRPQWQPRLGVLMEELRKAPSVLRLTYLADVEDEALVGRRIDAVKADIARMWQDVACCDPLSIETEIFWRRGAPPERARE